MAKPATVVRAAICLSWKALVEEAMAMVDNTDIYNRILDWVERLGPLCTVEKVGSGKYDDIYPTFSNEARDLRKELLGTLDPKALFPLRKVPGGSRRDSSGGRIDETNFTDQ